MKSEINPPFAGPMQPWPGLEHAVRHVQLPDLHVRLFTYQLGDRARPTLLLVHGLGDEADSWRHILAPLAQRWHVVALDLPGFGRSDKPDIAYTVPFYQRVIHQLVQALELPAVVLAGSSMGAVICQAVALEQPDWLRGLVLLDGALLTASQRLSLPLLLFLVPGLGEWLYTRLRKDPQVAYASLAGYYADLHGLPEAEQRFLYQRVNERVWDNAQRRAYFSALRNLSAYIPGQQKGLAERLKRLDLPTLILWGAKDQVMPLAAGQALARVLPQHTTRLVVFPNSGHLPQQDCPQEVIEQLSNFIEPVSQA